MVLLPIILVCLYLQSASGKFLPVPTPANVTCSGSDEVAKLVNGKIICWKLSSSCPMGFGLTVELGKVYPAEERISCDPCIEGSTFSDKDDFSQCKNCTRCWENEIPFGKCTISKDSITCECKSGFYRTNDDFSRCTKCKMCGKNESTLGLCTRENDNTTCECKPGYYRSPDAGHRCRHCTSCCGQANDDCSSPEANKCSVETICPTIPTPSYSTPGSTVSMSSNSKASIKSKSNKSQEQHDPTGGIVLAVLFSIIVLICLIILGYVKCHNLELYLWEKKRASTSSHQRYMVIGKLPQQAYFNRENSSVEFSSGSLENELTSASNANYHATNTLPPQVNSPTLQAQPQRVTPDANLPSINPVQQYRMKKDDIHLENNTVKIGSIYLLQNSPVPQPQLPRVTATAAQTGNQNALQVTGLPSNNPAPQPQLPRVTTTAAQTGNQNALQVTGLPSNNPAPQPQLLARVTTAAAQTGNQNALQVTGLPSNNPVPQPQLLARVTQAAAQTGSCLIDEEDQAIPSTGSDESTCIVPTLINIAHYDQGHSYVTTENQCIRSPCTQVTELPEDMLQNVCNILDEKDAFFQDYRMFTEELVMKKSVKLSPKNTTLRTYTVLKKYKVTIKTFLEIIQTIIQSNVGTSRADNLVQITEDVKSWLDYSTYSNFLTSAC